MRRVFVVGVIVGLLIWAWSWLYRPPSPSAGHASDLRTASTSDGGSIILEGTNDSTAELTFPQSNAIVFTSSGEMASDWILLIPERGPATNPSSDAVCGQILMGDGPQRFRWADPTELADGFYVGTLRVEHGRLAPCHKEP